MARTCETCGRSWDARATFCGACGALLDDTLATARATPWGASAWRHPAVAGVAVTLAVVGAVAAVPSLSIDRTPPVDGEIGVPETDDLQAAPADARIRRTVEPPRVECLRAEVAVECVTWSRALAPSMSTQGGDAWVVPAGDLVLVVTDDRIEAADAATGTRLWRFDPSGGGRAGTGTYPAGTVGDGGLVVSGPDHTAVLDLDEGTERWSSDAGSVAWGLGVDADMVLTHSTTTTGSTLVALDATDGSQRWRWESPWVDVHVMRPPGGDRLVVMSGAGSGLAVLDRRTGTEVTRSEEFSTAWVVGVVDTVAVLATALDQPSAPEPSAPDPGLAGDPGATLRGIDLGDGSQRWQHDVRAADHGYSLVDDLVLVPSTRRLTAIDARTGDVRWDVDGEGTEFVAAHGDIWSPYARPGAGPVRTLVTVDQARSLLRGRDPATGAVRWEREITDGVGHASVDEDRLLVFGGQDYLLLDAATGRQRLRVRAPGSSPVGADPLLLHDHATGYVTRIDPGGVTGR